MPQEALSYATIMCGSSEETAEYHWKLFLEFAQDENIDTEHADDFMPWWKFWIQGALEENQRD